jgi:hypothetical protein
MEERFTKEELEILWSKRLTEMGIVKKGVKMTPEQMKRLETKLAEAKDNLSDWKYAIFINEKAITDPEDRLVEIVNNLKTELPEYEAELAFYEEILMLVEKESVQYYPSGDKIHYPSGPFQINRFNGMMIPEDE